jgi:hypothetical protein
MSAPLPARDHAPPMGGSAAVARPWWETRPFVAVIILLSAVPLMYPANPPLVDLFGHMGRYRVQLDLASSPWLQQFYDFKWTLIGNLGVDLLVIPLSGIFGLELAVKLIVLAIPPMTVAGFLWVAREVHHRLPPTAMFALPFVYSFPFLFGFTNFTLAMALAFLAFGLWLRLGRLGRTRLRALLFVPISFIIFVTHAFGWGALGLLAFSAEAVRQHDKGIGWWKAGLRAAPHALVMIGPAFLMLAWRSNVQQGSTADWFNLDAKLWWVFMALRDRWKWFDEASVALAGIVLAIALFSKRLTYSRNLAFSALVLLAGFLVLPRIIFGSAYADMRLAPFMIATALLAIRFRGETYMPTAQRLAWLGLGFYVLRIGATTISLAMAADDQTAKLQALDHVPRGARMVALAGQACDKRWELPRNSHLGSMAIVRREAFSNDQWIIEGANLLSIRYRQAGYFMADPSQQVRPPACANRERWPVNRALAAIPRDAFDYVWLLDPPPFDPKLLDGMTPIWRGEGSLLYAIEKPGGHPQP